MKKVSFIDKIGIYLLFFLLLMIVIPIMTYLSSYNDYYITRFIYISCCGGVGGTIYTIRGFYKHLGEEDFKKNWKWWYIFRPVISCVVGIFLYFLVAGGLLSFGIIAKDNLDNGILFFCALSFLAGLSFTKVMNKFDNTASSLFSNK